MSEALEIPTEVSATPRARPFLKWAGGKSALLAELLPRMPYRFERYFEPFLGGGAVFFRLQPERSVLVDCNEELISVYRIVRDNVEELITELRQHVYDREYYYLVRNADREETFKGWDAVRRAGRLIYLNRTCFNGLYRVNAKGQFNVPFGRYDNPMIVDADNLRACSLALAKADVRLGSFDSVVEEASPKDFIYFDPPYFPLSPTSSFSDYTEAGFDADMHRRLAEVCKALDAKGVRFMVSNSAAPFVEGLFQGLRIERVLAPRAINSKGERRGAIPELIIRNY